MKPDESLFKQHVREPRFLAGVDSGKWGLHGNVEEIVWPIAILWVKAHEKIVSGGRLYLRFNLDGYSAQAPTSCPWDVEKNERLNPGKWPRGSGDISAVFNPGWNGGSALYCPCDRLAMKDHDQWKQQHPHWWWQSTFTITRYLEFVYRRLNPCEEGDE